MDFELMSSFFSWIRIRIRFWFSKRKWRWERWLGGSVGGCRREESVVGVGNHYRLHHTTKSDGGTMEITVKREDYREEKEGNVIIQEGV